MESHEQDLREEINDEATLRQLQTDHRQATLAPANRAMLDFAEKLTLTPRQMARADVEMLRQHGFDDRDILDIAQLVGYFNYSNRVMDSLGIEPEPHMRYRKQE